MNKKKDINIKPSIPLILYFLILLPSGLETAIGGIVGFILRLVPIYFFQSFLIGGFGIKMTTFNSYMIPSIIIFLIGLFIPGQLISTFLVFITFTATLYLKKEEFEEMDKSIIKRNT